jgi:pyruvate kinase
MLNKGPRIVEAISVLDDILRRMDRHHHKQRSLLPALHSSEYVHTDRAG